LSAGGSRLRGAPHSPDSLCSSWHSIANTGRPQHPARAWGLLYSGKILIEDIGVGTALIAELQDEGLYAIAVKPERDKITRMSVQSG
jgi:hypothetical protein